MPTRRRVLGAAAALAVVLAASLSSDAAARRPGSLATAARYCQTGTKVKIVGETKCLIVEEFCARRFERQYERYGFTCRRSGGFYRLHPLGRRQRRLSCARAERRAIGYLARYGASTGYAYRVEFRKRCVRKSPGTVKVNFSFYGHHHLPGLPFRDWHAWGHIAISLELGGGTYLGFPYITVRKARLAS